MSMIYRSRYGICSHQICSLMERKFMRDSVNSPIQSSGNTQDAGYTQDFTVCCPVFCIGTPPDMKLQTWVQDGSFYAGAKYTEIVRPFIFIVLCGPWWLWIAKEKWCAMYPCMKHPFCLVAYKMHINTQAPSWPYLQWHFYFQQIDFVISTLYNNLTERQKRFAKYAEQIQKIQEMHTVLSKVRMTVEQTIPLMERLNSVLPPEDQIEPFAMSTAAAKQS